MKKSKDFRADSYGDLQRLAEDIATHAKRHIGDFSVVTPFAELKHMLPTLQQLDLSSNTCQQIGSVINQNPFLPPPNTFKQLSYAMDLTQHINTSQYFESAIKQSILTPNLGAVAQIKALAQHATLGDSLSTKVLALSTDYNKWISTRNEIAKIFKISQNNSIAFQTFNKFSINSAIDEFYDMSIKINDLARVNNSTKTHIKFEKLKIKSVDLDFNFLNDDIDFSNNFSETVHLLEDAEPVQEWHEYLRTAGITFTSEGSTSTSPFPIPSVGEPSSEYMRILVDLKQCIYSFFGCCQAITGSSNRRQAFCLLLQIYLVYISWTHYAPLIKERLPKPIPIEVHFQENSPALIFKTITENENSKKRIDFEIPVLEIPEIRDVPPSKEDGFC